MTKRTTGLIAIAVAAMLGVGQSAIAQDPDVTNHHLLSHHIQLTGTARTTVELAVHGAIRRLSRPGCQQLFTDFTDATGRELAVNLAATGDTPTRLLTELFYVDADHTLQCRRNGGVAAFTVPGSRIVHVCARRFGHFVPNTSNEEIVLIHELLHTLGLGENPPTSSHITKVVRNRCS